MSQGFFIFSSESYFGFNMNGLNFLFFYWSLQITNFLLEVQLLYYTLIKMLVEMSEVYCFIIVVLGNPVTGIDEKPKNKQINLCLKFQLWVLQLHSDFFPGFFEDGAVYLSKAC